MKFLHTSDWHVGKTLKGHNRLDEQEAVLNEIVGLANDYQVDAVLIAGDLSTPPRPMPTRSASSSRHCWPWPTAGQRSSPSRATTTQLERSTRTDHLRGRRHHIDRSAPRR